MHTKKSLGSNFFTYLIKNSTWLYIGWVFFIALLTLLPGSVIPDISWDFVSIDKTVHIIMFSVLVFIGLIGSQYGTLNIFGRWPVITSMALALAYGYMLELIQSYIPQRSYDFADLTADCVGTIVGYGLFLGMSKILPRKSR